MPNKILLLEILELCDKAIPELNHVSRITSEIVAVAEAERLRSSGEAAHG